MDSLHNVMEGSKYPHAAIVCRELSQALVAYNDKGAITQVHVSV